MSILLFFSGINVRCGESEILGRAYVTFRHQSSECKLEFSQKPLNQSIASTQILTQVGKISQSFQNIQTIARKEKAALASKLKNDVIILLSCRRICRHANTYKWLKNS